MASWRKLIVLAALLPTLAAAADPAMLELIMPEARFVVYMNVGRLVNSPIGQAMSVQLKGQLQNLHPDAQQAMSALNGVDWTRYAQEVIFAGTGQGKDAPAIGIVRGLLDPAWVESLHTFQGEKSAYMGVPMVSSTNGSSAVAFLEGSITVIGSAAEVRAAIRRRGQNQPISPVLADGLQRYDTDYDAWVVTAGPLVAAAPKALSAPNAPNTAGMKWPDHLESLNGGVRFSPDLEISADLTMRTEKDVADMANTLRWFTGVVRTQAQGAASLDKMDFKAEGRRLSISLQVPEQEVRAALQQRQNAQAAPRPRAVRPPDIASGLPEPPPGSIRVQSSPSDMGTVVLPLKPQ